MAQTYDPITTLNELIKGIDSAMLTTIRPDGSVHSCPMAARESDPDGVLWFISNSNTEKVEAVRTSPRVNIAYADHPAQRYVSVSGYCELMRDHARARALWSPKYTSWFGSGLDDPNLILLKITVQQAEYWDGSLGRMVDLLGFTKATIA